MKEATKPITVMIDFNIMIHGKTESAKVAVDRDEDGNWWAKRNAYVPSINRTRRLSDDECEQAELRAKLLNGGVK